MPEEKYKAVLDDFMQTLDEIAGVDFKNANVKESDWNVDWPAYLEEETTINDQLESICNGWLDEVSRMKEEVANGIDDGVNNDRIITLLECVLDIRELM